MFWKNKKLWLAAAAVLLIAAFWIERNGVSSPLELEESPPPVSFPKDSPVLSLEQAFVRVAAAVSPAVVNIRAQWTEQLPQYAFRDLEDFFNYWFYGAPPGGRPLQRREQSLGSGFLITKDGHIVTNAHVLGKAAEVQVRLQDGRRFKAKVIGLDEATDIGLIRIETSEKLPAVVLGDSDAVQVGQWVLAIGNPFGLDHTVTSGVISAKGRSVPLKEESPYRSYLQTDASINPGNSGGPLCNIRGEVIGMNTAIFSQTGGSIGIGFAIPSNVIRKVVMDLKAQGKVDRAGLGVTVQDLDADLARSFGMKTPEGVLITSVSPGSAAAKAGLKRGDVVLTVDGKKVRNSADLVALLYTYRAGDKVEVEYLRSGKPMKAQMRLQSLNMESPREKKEEKKEKLLKTPSIGLEFDDPENVPQLVSPDTPRGAVVVKVDPRSAAQRAGLAVGDVILEVNGQEVESAADLRRVLKDADLTKGVRVLFWREGATLYTFLKKEE